MVLRERSQASDDVVDQRGEVVPAPFGMQRAGLHPGEVEQIADDPAEPTGLGLDVRQEALALGVGPLHVRLPKAAGGRDDRGERRA